MTKLTVAALQLAFTDDTVATSAPSPSWVREAASKGAEWCSARAVEGPYFGRTEDESLFANARPTADIPRCWRQELAKG